MRMTRCKRILAGAFLVIAMAVVGCESDPTFQRFQGSYEGTETLGEAAISVLARVVVLSSEEMDLHVLQRGEGGLWREIKVIYRSGGLGKDEVEILGIPGVPGVPFHLKRNSSECFRAITSDSQADMTSEFCTKGEVLSFDFQTGGDDASRFSYRLNLKKSSQDVEPPPRSYRVSALMNSTMMMSVNSRLQYENFVQGKLRARNAYLNLLPHLTGATVLGLVSGGGVMGALGAIGDLAPFLLPSRWFQAEEAAELREAQKIGISVVQLDAAQITEALAFEVLRGRRFLVILTKNREEVQTIFKELLFREGVGQLPPGSADELAGILNGIERDVLELRETVREAVASLALTVGFGNPEAISEIVDDIPENIAHPEAISESVLKEQALSRSLELAQLDWLIKAAQAGTQERIFNWIDGSGDGTGGLGAGLPDSINIGKSAERQLEIQKENLRAQILGKVSTGVAFQVKVLERFQLALVGLEIQDRRVKRFEEDLHSGSDFPLMELASSLRERAQAQLEKAAIESDYRVGFSKIQRLALKGPYAKQHLVF